MIICRKKNIRDTRLSATEYKNVKLKNLVEKSLLYFLHFNNFSTINEKKLFNSV